MTDVDLQQRVIEVQDYVKDAVGSYRHDSPDYKVVAEAAAFFYRHPDQEPTSDALVEANHHLEEVIRTSGLSEERAAELVIAVATFGFDRYLREGFRDGSLLIRTDYLNEKYRK